MNRATRQRARTVHVTWVVFAAALLLPGCTVRQQYAQPKLQDDIDHVMRDIDLLPAFPTADTKSGSLWSDAGVGAALVRDLRAFRINDLLTIDVDETTLGTNEAITQLDRASEADVGASVAFGQEDPNPTAGKFNLNQVLNSRFETSFSGDGATSRSNLLAASITARVMRVLPNGDLVIAAQKNVMINREQQILTLVGSVRPVDVNRENRVPSDRIGNLTVRLWGQGEVDDTARQGWFMRVFNRIWPF